MGEKEPTKRRRINCKTGCRTCKIRKVKCDEGRPACHRCVSTGRLCEGYGIWGGGGDYRPLRGSGTGLNDLENRRSAVALRLPPCITSPTGSSEELLMMDWFRCRTIQKIPGLFGLAFWAELALKATATEPAIMAAIIALSSSHKQHVEGYSTEADALVLEQYIKAIDNLHPHFSSKDHASRRVALVACVLFVCLELLRGNFKFAQKHLKAGLLILHESQSALVQHGVIQLCITHSSVDWWIAEAFSRLHLQFELFHQTFVHPVVILALPRRFTEFCTINEAWYDLERLFHRILHLIERFRIRDPAQEPEISERDGLMIDLATWKSIYALSKSQLDLVEPSGTAHHLLSEYHEMASIMCATSGRCDENAFDGHIAQFRSILEHSISMYKAPFSRSGPGWPIFDKRDFGTAHSMVDMGWIPPLYYIAVKCRVRRIRIHAVRLLEYTSHREGIWDSRVVARITRKVLDLEDGVPSDETETNFDLESVPTEDSAVLITVPLERRLREVRVLLEDETTVKLWYRRGNGSWDFM